MYGFTRHSPEGPLLYLEYYMLQSPALVSATLRNLRTTQVVLFQRKSGALHIEKQFHDLTEPEVVGNFQTESPPCPSETLRDGRYVLLFRRPENATAPFMD